MKRTFHLGQNEFDALLGLFADDREEAARAYEKLRRGLIRYFRYKGCTEPNELADEVFDRVAARVDRFDRTLGQQPDAFIYGFAVRIAMEHKRKMARLAALDSGLIGSSPGTPRPEFSEPQLACLQTCLNELKNEDRELVVEYYSREGQERIRLRHEMCEKLGCRPNALHVRVLRIRKRLAACIGKCLGEKM